MPALLDASMLRSWWVFKLFHERWGADFDDNEWRSWKIVPRGIDFYKEILKTDSVTIMQVEGIRKDNAALSRANYADWSSFFGSYPF